MDVLLGLDVGTTGAKAGVFDLVGRPLGIAYAAYPLRTTEPGAAEQDPEDWWRALGSLVRRVLPPEVAGRVAAVGVGAHGPTCVAADADRRPTCPAVTWLDMRCTPEAELIASRLGQSVPVWGSWSARALWIAHHRPEAFARTRWLFTAWDYLTSRLTGSPHAAALAPEHEELLAADLSPGLQPPSVAPGQLVGTVHPRAAEEIGLPAGVPVAAGLPDGINGVFGSGIRSAGQACVNAGTSGTLVVLGSPGQGWRLLGLHLVGAGINTYGKALDWVRTEVYAASYEAVLHDAAAVAPGADGLLFLPYLAGERAPFADPQARGAFVGMTLRHRRAHLARAVLEGVAFAVRQVAEVIDAAGGVAHEIRVVGGAARAPLWNQILADVLGKPVLQPAVLEGSVLGAALIAGTSAGRFTGLDSAAARMVHVARRFVPDPTARATYDRLYPIYAAGYPALKDLNWRLAERSSQPAMGRSISGNGGAVGGQHALGEQPHRAGAGQVWKQQEHPR